MYKRLYRGFPKWVAVAQSLEDARRFFEHFPGLYARSFWSKLLRAMTWMWKKWLLQHHGEISHDQWRQDTPVAHEYYQ